MMPIYRRRRLSKRTRSRSSYRLSSTIDPQRMQRLRQLPHTHNHANLIRPLMSKIEEITKRLEIFSELNDAYQALIDNLKGVQHDQTQKIERLQSTIDRLLQEQQLSLSSSPSSSLLSSPSPSNASATADCLPIPRAVPRRASPGSGAALALSNAPSSSPSLSSSSSSPSSRTTPLEVLNILPDDFYEVGSGEEDVEEEDVEEEEEVDENNNLHHHHHQHDHHHHQLGHEDVQEVAAEVVVGAEGLEDDLDDSMSVVVSETPQPLETEIIYDFMV